VWHRYATMMWFCFWSHQEKILKGIHKKEWCCSLLLVYLSRMMVCLRVVLALRSLYYAGLVLVQVAAERGLFTLAFNVQVFNFCHFTIDTRCYKLFTVWTVFPLVSSRLFVITYVGTTG
jgi:hypothetical protein